jgi:hypothetical protein
MMGEGARSLFPDMNLWAPTDLVERFLNSTAYLSKRSLQLKRLLAPVKQA